MPNFMAIAVIYTYAHVACWLFAISSWARGSTWSGAINRISSHSCVLRLAVNYCLIARTRVAKIAFNDQEKNTQCRENQREL